MYPHENPLPPQTPPNPLAQHEPFPTPHFPSTTSLYPTNPSPPPFLPLLQPSSIIYIYIHIYIYLFMFLALAFFLCQHSKLQKKELATQFTMTLATQSSTFCHTHTTERLVSALWAVAATHSGGCLPFQPRRAGEAIEIDQIHPPEIMCGHGMHVVFICDAWSVHVKMMSCYAMPCMLTCMRDLFAVYRAPARSLDASSKANFNPAQARTREKLSCDQKTQRQESCRISHQSRRICPFGMSFLCQMHDLTNPIFIHQTASISGLRGLQPSPATMWAMRCSFGLQLNKRKWDKLRYMV